MKHENIIDILRQRRGLEGDNASEDTVIQQYSARKALDELAAWHLGYPGWAGTILSWLEDCGYRVIEPE